MNKEQKKYSNQKKDSSFSAESSYQQNQRSTTTDFPKEIVDIENDKMIIADCMGATRKQLPSLKVTKPRKDEKHKQDHPKELPKTNILHIDSLERITPQCRIKEDPEKNISSQPGLDSKTKSYELRLAPALHIETRIKENPMKGKYKGLRLAPRTYDEDNCQNENNYQIENTHQNENNRQNENSRQNENAIMGMDNNNDNEEGFDSETERLNSHLSSQDVTILSQDVIVANVVDNVADQARIIGDFIAGTAQATIVKKKPFWKRRNLLLGVLGLLLLLVIGIVVLTLRLQKSNEEILLKTLGPISGKEALLGQNSPQNKAYQWLLTDEKYLLNSMANIQVRERYIAALFYFSTGGSFWVDKFEFLNNKKSVCNWNNGNVTGIQCSEEQTIISISAVENNLTGVLPSELSGLSSLESIIINQNMLKGTIPSKLGNLYRLKTLKLSSNSLMGTIPRKIFDMRNLKALKVSNNLLTGTIYEDFTKLSSLEFLDLGGNFLSGSIPSKFNPISRLKRISLSSNKLTGSIPETIKILASTLEHLQLAANNLNMTIPSSIESCRRLKTISLDYNLLSGSLPTELGLLIDLQSIRIRNNRLTGKIPSELGNLWKLGSIELSDNSLSGQIPSELGHLKSVATIRLQKNKLTGSLPAELASSIKLSLLSVYRNNLRGKVGKALCQNNIEIQADCKSPDPEVECDCCDCCNDDHPLANCTESDNCEGTVKKIIEDNLIKGSRGKVDCWCVDLEGLHVICDESCYSCNLDESICVENISFQLWIKHREATFPDRFENKVKYIKGRNETIEWGSSGWEQYDADACWVRINGIECNACVVKQCANKNAPYVSCSNIVGAGDYDGCDGDQAVAAGVFEAVSWSFSKSLVKDTFCPVLDPLNIWNNFL